MLENALAEEVELTNRKGTVGTLCAIDALEALDVCDACVGEYLKKELRDQGGQNVRLLWLGGSVSGRRGVQGIVGHLGLDLQLNLRVVR